MSMMSQQAILLEMYHLPEMHHISGIAASAREHILVISAFRFFTRFQNSTVAQTGVETIHWQNVIMNDIEITYNLIVPC